jgi:hypothetical protein
VAIDGEQSGPYAFAEIVRRVQAKEIIGRHYVWHDGMDGWKRVREMPDLQPHLGHEKKKPPPIPSTGDHTFNQRPRGGGAEVVDFATKRKERDQKKGTGPSADRDLDDRHGEFPTEAKVKAESPSPRVDQLDHVLNEALGIHGEGSTQRAGAVAVHATAGIAGETTAPKPQVEDLLAFDKDDIFANVPRATQSEIIRKESTRFFVAAAGMHARRRQQRLGMVIGGTFAACVATFMLFWYMGVINVSIPGIGNPFDRSGDKIDQDPTSLESIDPDDPNAVKKILDDEGRKRLAIARAKRARAKRAAEGGFIDDPTDRGRGGGPRGLDEGVAEKIDDRLGGGVMKEVVPGTEGLRDSDLSQVPLPEGKTLSQEAISRVINERKKSVSICYQQSLRGNEDLRGKLEFTVTIERTGAVSRASIETTAFKGTKLARCIANKIRDWRFPPFEGEAQQVQVPFVLEKNSY